MIATESRNAFDGFRLIFSEAYKEPPQIVERETVRTKGFTPIDCRRFCSCQSTKIQQRSTAFNEQPATGSTAISWKRKTSTSFNRCWNLVRDQGVGGSNPLSPTICFHSLTFHHGLQEPATWFYPRWSSAHTRINTALLFTSKCCDRHKICCSHL